jgi:hypothetical protein
MMANQHYRWNDLNVSTATQTLGYDRYALNTTEVVPQDSAGVSVSSYLPLWAGLFPATEEDWTSAAGQAEREAVLASLSSSGLIQIGTAPSHSRHTTILFCSFTSESSLCLWWSCLVLSCFVCRRGANHDGYLRAAVGHPQRLAPSGAAAHRGTAHPTSGLGRELGGETAAIECPLQ